MKPKTKTLCEINSKPKNEMNKKEIENVKRISKLQRELQLDKEYEKAQLEYNDCLDRLMKNSEDIGRLKERTSGTARLNHIAWGMLCSTIGLTYGLVLDYPIQALILFWIIMIISELAIWYFVRKK